MVRGSKQESIDVLIVSGIEAQLKVFELIREIWCDEYLCLAATEQSRVG